MASILDHFKFSLHTELEALERELVQTVQERIVKEGGAFPGEINKIEALVEVDLDAVLRSSASCRTVRQVQQEEG
jgi:hypothetical protein